MVKKNQYALFFIISLCLNIVSCSSIPEITLENSKEDYIIQKNINVHSIIGSNKLLFNMNNDTEDLIDNNDNVLFSYNLNTKETERYLETINENYVFKNIYNINDRWLVWIESQVKVDIIHESTGGKYIIGAKDLETGEIFKVKEMNSSAYSDPIVNVDPSCIVFDGDTIAYKTMGVLNNSYYESVETYNLKTRKVKKEHSIPNFFNRRISNISLKDGKIAYCESSYDPESNPNSKLYYYHIGSKKEIILEENDKTFDMEDPFLTKDGIYLSKFILGDELTETSLSFLDLKTKKENELFKESDFNELGTFPILEYKKDNALIFQSTYGTLIYDINKDNFIKTNLEIASLKFLGDYALLSYFEDDNYKSKLIKL